MPIYGNIMIVDDNPANLRLLEEMLTQQGHEVCSFPLGRLALAAAMKKQPDLILLDINMPEMNGYEVCEHLKAIPETADVSVIFLSALTDTEDKVKAFRFGAVDYISKPFQFGEVTARVQTHLKLHFLKRELKQQNDRLELAVAARTRELAEANQRLTILDHSKNEFLNLISHEFRTPLNGLLGVGDIILADMPPTDDNRELQRMFERSRLRILSILDDALLLAQIDVSGAKFRPASILLNSALRRAMEKTAEFSDSRCVKFVMSDSTTDRVLGDEHLLVRAFHALLETAAKFSIPGDTVYLSCLPQDGSPHVAIVTQGGTIPPAALPKFFDLFSIAEALTPGGDLGLGPPVAFRILSLFGASVTVENRDPTGIRLTISLKEAAPEYQFSQVPSSADPLAGDSYCGISH